MKLYRYSVIIMFIFSPYVLYSQILDSNDIDIFINNSAEIETIYNEWDNYLEQTLKLVEYMSGILYRSVLGEKISNDEFISLKEKYLEFLEIDTPKEYINIYKRIGLGNNGTKKLITMSWVVVVLKFEELGFPKTDKLLSMFDKNDIKIVRNRMNELENL